MARPPVPIATTQQLRAQGFSRRDIDHDVQTGVFRRIRPGYFARPEAPVSLVRAIQAGGVATGLTALQHYGVWVPDDPRTHVLVGAHGRGVLDPDVVVHWGSAFLTAPLTGRRFRPVVPIAVALEHALPFLEPHLAVAVGDSALNLGLLGPGMLERIVEALPAHSGAGSRGGSTGGPSPASSRSSATCCRRRASCRSCRSGSMGSAPSTC